MLSGVIVRPAMQSRIRKGYVVPFEEYSDQYVRQGEIVRSGGVGTWNTNFQMPWDYREN
jgi:endonuclease YncB( thermonuclease family)